MYKSILKVVVMEVVVLAVIVVIIVQIAQYTKEVECQGQPLEQRVLPS